MTIANQDPVATWFAGVLRQGYVMDPLTRSSYDLANQNPVPNGVLRADYEAAAKGHRRLQPWNIAMRRVKELVTQAGQIALTRPRTGAALHRDRVLLFPPLSDMVRSFEVVTGLKPEEVDT